MYNGSSFFIDKKSKKGVLLLHAFTSTTHQFRELGPYLANKGLTVFAPLLAGHGTSPDDLIKTNHRDWLKSAEEGLKFLQTKTEQIYIVGNSFGGNLAFELSLNYPVAGIISLGTPIFLRHQRLIKFRLATDCRFRKYYRKPPILYRIDYTDFSDEVTYPVIPIKSLRDCLYFIEFYTIPHLSEVKSPILIIHATGDQIIRPKSAQYIHEHIGSDKKMIYWIKSFLHNIVVKSEIQLELFDRIYQFIKEN